MDQQIEAAIAAAERRSAAEIAVAFLPRAEPYRATALLAAMTLFALFYMVAIWFDAGSLGFTAAGRSGAWLSLPGWVGPGAALCLAIFCFLICEHTSLGVRLTPAAYRQQACRIRAKLLFFDHGIDATQDRLGVLICLSRAERQIDILADRGVAAVIPDERWRQLIDDFRRHKGDMALEAAVARLVAAVADELALHFPPWPGQRNELPDRPLRP
jgi:putative membrane protein